jgi:uncharacterized membrane protein YtjA (UPF0391 family)
MKFGTGSAAHNTRRPTPPQKSGVAMLGWSITFFIIAIVAAVFGFGGIAGEASWIGQVLLVIFLILAIVSLIFGRRTPVV